MPERAGSHPTQAPEQSPTWPTGFMVLHGNRLEDLRRLLIEHVRRFPLPGLEPEWVVLQSTGMKQWLEQGLASHQGLGICAATRMVFPAELLWHVYRVALGPDAVPTDLPLDREHLVWRLMRCLPAWLNGPDAACYDELRRYIQASDGRPDDARLLQLCQQLAGLYDGYQNYRSDWLGAWSLGDATLTDAAGRACPLPQDQHWQMRLWQQLRLDVLADASQSSSLAPSRAEVHQAYIQRMAQGAPPGLPKRVLVFGVSALPMQTIEALASLGRHAQVMVFVLNPCQHHWGHIVSERQMLQGVMRSRQASKDGTPIATLTQASWHTDAQPLLAAWGQHGRDFLHLLDIHDDVERYRHLLERIDYFTDPTPAGAPGTRLQQLQSDILHLNSLPSSPLPTSDHDDSFTFIRAHSAVREIELLHDQVLQWLEDDPQLHPKDIMVMVPDMAPVAALIHAVWGRFAPEDPLRIPYSLTDQNAKDHPMASIVEAMLEGPNARVTLDDWLSWLEVPAFARAFDFPMDELFQVRSALKEAGIRWGLDAAHRLQSGMALSPQDAAPTTWMFGLQRLLLAQAQGPLHESEWQGIVPASGRSTLSPAALGALCSSLQTVREVLQKVQAPRPVASWVQDLQHMLNRLLRPNSESEEKALMALMDPLTRWLHACQIAGLTTDVSLSVVRSHWLSELAEAASGNRFLSGGVQFATLLPMRSIPFKRVCLLGMNDGAYPRRQPLTDFDLMRLPDLRRPGDRSRREDDRYLFLEALLCAREKIYISWQGWQTHDPSQLYPSVLVGQLIEHLNATHTDPVVVRDAPMQAFSRRYFERPDAPWKTYATDWAVARGWQDPSDTSARVPDSPQEATEVALPDILKLTELIGMLRQPLDVFYRHRLGLKWQEPEEVLPDAEPFKLETLDTYRLVAAALQEPEQFSVQARASGRLPLGPMADPPLRQLNSQIKALTDRMAGVLQGGDWQALPEQNLLWPLPPTSTHLGMRQLQATTGDNHWYTNSRGEWIQAMLRPGVMTKKKVLQIHGLLSAWVHHLMANACGRSCTTHLLCLDQAKVLSPLAADQASEQLMALLEAYRQAWQSPMPVPGRTACEWLAQKHKPSKSDADKLTQQAHRQAKAIFMGSRFSTREPERLSAPMIRRHANDYNQVMGPIETWAPQLYLGLIQALQGSSEADAEADDE